jgi:hypothetical protein
MRLDVQMNEIDPELDRLGKAARDAHERYLRLESFHDVQVVEAAYALWRAALAALDDCRALKESRSQVGSR